MINVVDSTNLERNLYLTLQIMEMGVPVVIALNMFDEAETLGLDIDIGQLSELLGVEVVPTVAVDGEGVDELLEAAFRAARSRSSESEESARECCGASSFRIDYGPAVEAEITALERYLTEIVPICHGPPNAGTHLSCWRRIRGLLPKSGHRAAAPSTSSELSNLELEVAAAQARILETAGKEAVDIITEVRYNKAAEIAQAVIGRQEAAREGSRTSSTGLLSTAGWPIRCFSA